MRSVNDDQLIEGALLANKIYIYIIALQLVLNIGLGVGLFGVLFYAQNKIEGIERQYFASTPDGGLFKLTPLDQPIGGEERAMYFSSTCVIKMFTLDYVNHLRQMSNAQRSCFTDPGYNSYIDQLGASGIMEPLKNPKTRLVVAATPGPGEFKDKGPRNIGGVIRMTYTIRHPIDFVFNGNVNAPRRGFIETDVIRIDQAERPDGLAVHAIRVKVSK